MGGLLFDNLVSPKWRHVSHSFLEIVRARLALGPQRCILNLMKTTANKKAKKTQADLDNELLDSYMTEADKARWKAVGEDEKAKWG